MDGGRRWQIPFAAALLVQCWALYVPRAPGFSTTLPLDKVVHFGLFALVTWLALLAGVPARWTAALMLGQAAASEVIQQFWLPQRGGDVWDFAADVLGIAAGLLLARGRRDRARRSSGHPGGTRSAPG